MKSEENNNADNNGFKKESNEHTNEINVGSVGSGNNQDNGASTLRELRRKNAGKVSTSTKRRPML